MLFAIVAPALVGVIIAIPASVIGYLGYRRSVKGDKIVEQAGIATTHENSIGQVISGLNGIITNLQNDNAVLRTNYSDLRARFDKLEADYHDLRARFLAIEKANGLSKAD